MRQLICLVFLSVLHVGAQDLDSLRSDTTVLTLTEFLDLVLDNHPVVKQARIIREGADAELLTARGGFDPKVSMDYDLKNFDEKEYFDLFNATLKVPTWVGIEPKISLDRNQGQFINPENSIPDENRNRQINTGISVPIGKGLFIDQRRATLNQARQYLGIAEAEQNKMVNKILLKATKDYWNWFLAYQELDFIDFSLGIAEEIYERVKLDYQYGEVAVIDTIQAKISLQTRQADFEKIKFELENARLNTSFCTLG
jgi:hypothetical protein